MNILGVMSVNAPKECGAVWLILLRLQKIIRFFHGDKPADIPVNFLKNKEIAKDDRLLRTIFLLLHTTRCSSLFCIERYRLCFRTLFAPRKFYPSGIYKRLI